jgi:hypothetical protein
LAIGLRLLSRAFPSVYYPLIVGGKSLRGRKHRESPDPEKTGFASRNVGKARIGNLLKALTVSHRRNEADEKGWEIEDGDSDLKLTWRRS